MPLHVAHILDHAAEKYPDHVALIALDATQQRTQFSYAQWRHAARAWARWLHQCDVRDGDRVALLAGNGLSFAAQWFGVIYAGCSVVPIPVTSSVQEVAFRIEHAGCRALLCDEARLGLAREAIANVVRRPIVAVDSDVAIDADAVVTLKAEAGDEDTAMILYTSGTTANAKGARISHRALVTHTRVLVEQVLALDHHDRVLGVLPLTHSYGCRMLLLATAHAGATTLLTARFDAVSSLGLIDAHALSWVPAVPTMFSAWSQAVERGDAIKPVNGTLRWAMSAGAPIVDALVARAEAALGCAVRQAYGMTEATLSTVNGPADARVIGSVGRAAPGVELRVLDEQQRDMPIGERGEIWIRGHNTMSGYLDDEAATASALREGWFRSGDVGRIDADGNLWIVDRIKDLIIVGGFNVVPSEVEAVIAQHPSVAEVAVVGRPHDYYGEEVVALVILKALDEPALDEPSLIEFCQARLSKLKCPRAVIFRDAFPLGPSGKVLKRVLREEVSSQERANSPRDGRHGTS